MNSALHRIVLGALIILSMNVHVGRSLHTQRISALKTLSACNFKLHVTTDSDVMSDEIQQSSKRFRTGTEPQFSIPDDSVQEKPFQRALLYIHFSLFAINLGLYASEASSSITGLSIVTSSFAVILSIIFGDFAVSLILNDWIKFLHLCHVSQTGVFHFSVDNYGSINTPVFGSICAAFQGHHATPWTITFRSFCNNLYKISYGTIPALLLLALSPPESCSPEFRLFLTLFINWWLLSQEFHKWSHMRNPPKFARFLQDKGIILSRKEHGLHHSEPFDKHYCILTGKQRHKY